MSLYNMISGMDVAASLCIKMSGIPVDEIPRLRDAWLSEDGQTFVILTRTGGGNRDYYQEANDKMATYSGFLGDEDDDFDQTYAHFTYSVPEEYREQTTKIAAGLKKVNRGADTRGPSAGVQAFFEGRPTPAVDPDDPDILAANEAFYSLASKLGMVSDEPLDETAG